jgi:signal peptidase II
VIDFIDVFYGSWHWPTFNIADSAISVGAAILLLDAFLGRNKTSPAP